MVRDGSLGERNDVVCAGLEEKLGIHASPTAVMKFGEAGGAVGYLVGEENRGLHTMFVMMNAARLAVGIQGVAIAERATQRALGYASERRQGRTAATPAGEMAPLIEHPDIRRSLLTMRALTAAARAICLATAREIDISRRAAGKGEHRAAAHRVALLTPVAKAFSTDIGCEVASIGVQVHGGMGFVEETGAAQYYRDARILPIYEGTNGIQAIDLVTRKLPLEGGAVVRSYLAELEGMVREVKAANRPELGRMGQRLSSTVVALGEATSWMLESLELEPRGGAGLRDALPQVVRARGRGPLSGQGCARRDSRRHAESRVPGHSGPLFRREPIGRGSRPCFRHHDGGSFRSRRRSRARLGLGECV